MLRFKQLTAIAAASALLVSLGLPAGARTRRGDRLYQQARQAEQAREYDKALELYEQALATDTSEVIYQMGYRRVRFQAGQLHVDQGRKLRDQGKLTEALAEFERALVIDPASAVAEQELERTRDMLERQRAAEAAGKPARVEPPAASAKRQVDERLAAVMSVPELKPLVALPQNIRINNQPARVMFETICKLAGINVIFDMDFNQAPGATTPRSLELNNATLEEALNYVALMTRAFWKPISSNTIFVTQDNPQKRNDYEDQVAKIIYLNNVGADKDLGEILTGIRQMIPTLRMGQVTSQNALIVRGTADQVALAEMMIRNLDKPKGEVVVDVIVMEVNRSASRDLALTPTSGSTSGISMSAGLTATTGEATGGAGTVRLSRLGRLSSGDFSVTLPGAALKALMTESNARILQSPQVRAIDNMKASLRIGERQPYSTGGFQPIFGQATTGASSLYSSFQYLDVGVNVDITPKIHGTDEVSLHVELEISNIKERIDIGGISQPVVGQRKIIHDIRLREGEVSLLGGLVNEQQTKSVSGVPGLASIPVLGRLFSSENIQRSQSELLIALVPRIVRTPEMDDLSFKGIASGNLNVVRLNYAPQSAEATPAAPAKPAATPGAAPSETVPKPETPAPAAQPRVTLSPEKVETRSGASFTLNLQVENVTDLFSAPVVIKFDPNVVRVSEVNRGSFMVADGREAMFTRNINNDTGEVRVILSRMPATPGVSGSGSLLTITFQVVGQGVTVISVPQLTFQDSRMTAILSASPQATVTIR